MSTKTLRKRIALVAVSALGAGLLSVVAVPSASAANSNAVAASTFTISTTATKSGSGSADDLLTKSSSKGWVTTTGGTPTANSNGGLDLTSGSATGIVLSSAEIAFQVGGTAAGIGWGVSVVVTGGTLTGVRNSALDSSASTAVSGDVTTAVLVQNATTMGKLVGVAKISAAAGSVATIAAYSGQTIVGTTTATSGTLLGIWTLTVASGSVSGVVSNADSNVYQQASVTKGTVAGGGNLYDTTSRINNGKVGIVLVELNDAYTADVTTGTLTATATNGSTVKIADAASDTGAEAYAATTAFSSVTPAASNYIYVNQPVSGVAGSTTLTITHNGTVVGTKTLNWNGDIASLTVDTVNSTNLFANGADDHVDGSNGSAIVYIAKDAAGNVLNLTAAPTLYGATGALVAASLSTDATIAAQTGTTYGTLQYAALGYGVATIKIPEDANLQGAATYKLKITNSIGTAIYSSVVNATVSNGGLDSFTATWDKSSYSPGEIAVLTVSGKDIYGNKIADGTVASGWSGTVAGSATAGFVSVGTACTAAKAFSQGYFTCKYAANTEGAWSYSIDLSTGTPQSATVGALKITSGGGVSNADVLKAIVSLIASINKQIAALQKALLKK